jgi:hypothetical protein
VDGCIPEAIRPGNDEAVLYCHPEISRKRYRMRGLLCVPEPHHSLLETGFKKPDGVLPAIQMEVAIDGGNCN